MATTFELFDGSTTINFVGSTNYKANISSVRFGAPQLQTVLSGLLLRNVTRGPREIAFDLRIVGSTVADLVDKVRDLENMIATAEDRQVVNEGTIVVLKTQLADTDADDVEWRVLTGVLDIARTSFDEIMVSQFNTPNARLTLLVVPFGRLTAVAAGDRLGLEGGDALLLESSAVDGLALEVSSLVENEQDDPTFNYFDLIDIPGTHGARMQLKIHDDGGTWNGSKKTWIAKRSGSRRTDTLFIQAEDDDTNAEVNQPGTGGPGSEDTFSVNDIVEASASGGNSIKIGFDHDGFGTSTWTTGYKNLGYIGYNIAGGSLPKGLFRVLVRANIQADIDDTRVNPATMGFALGWEFGGKSKVPVDGEEVYTTTENVYQIIDLGELVIPPVEIPDGFTAPTLNLRIYATLKLATSATATTGEQGKWASDYIFLLPIDEGSAIVDAVSTSDRILVDGLSDTPGVYILNASDVVQKFATVTGGPFDVGPEDTRIFWLRDDTGNPTNITAVLTPVLTPEVVDI